MTDLELLTKDLDELERLKDNFDWFYSNYIHLKKYYKNQYVAVENKKYLDNDKSFDTLVERLKITNYSNSIAIEFVYD